MESNKWQMHQAGLFNFWYYDDQVYRFSDGKLLLRGSNGSGKSVTMQSLITVLLDGRKSPDRLDPFGSKARRMEDYLLGEKDVVDRDERTGYLYLEYKRSGSEQYMTTGIGMQAKRNGKFDSWGFILLDNRRIGIDFKLYKTEYSPEGKEEHIPLTRGELERAVGTGGHVVQGQKDYMEMVNKHVFGFETNEAYEDLMKLLIQLRSPKLSKEFKPTSIYEILNASLPGLSDEELRPLSDTIENMEQTKEQLAKLEMEQKSLEKLCRHYEQYNQFVLAEKAQKCLEAARHRDKLVRVQQEDCRKLNQDEKSLAEKIGVQVELNREREVLQKEREELAHHDVFKAEQEKYVYEQKLAQEREKQIVKQDDLTDKQRKERGEQEFFQRAETKAIEVEQEIKESLSELLLLADEGYYSDHGAACGQFERSYQTAYDFSLWKQECGVYQQRLQQVLAMLREQTVVKGRYDEADIELGMVRQQYDQARSKLRKAEQHFSDKREALLADFYQWIKQQEQILPFEPAEIKQAATAIQALQEGALWQNVLEVAAQALRRRMEMWYQKEAVLNERLKGKELERIERMKERESWQKRRDPEPERHEDTRATRLALLEKDIPHVAFYEAVEFQDHVTQEQRERIESALREMGLLDALIVPESVSPTLEGAIYDKVIRSQPCILQTTLADYLLPTPPGHGKISVATIDNVLRSIVIDDFLQGLGGDVGGNPMVSVKHGWYQNGVLAGQAPREREAIYIGREARRRYRQQQIDRLTQEIEQVELAIDEGMEQLRQVRLAKQQVDESYGLMPTPQVVLASFEECQSVTREAGFFEGEVTRKNEKLRELNDQLLVLKGKLREGAAGMSVALSEDVYQKAANAMKQYDKEIHSLELHYRDYWSSKETIKRSADALADLVQTVNALKGECHVLADEIRLSEMRIEQISKRLQEMGAEEIRTHIQKLVDRLDSIPHELDATGESIGSLRTSILLIQEKIKAFAVEEEFANGLYGCWQTALREEVQLRLVEELRQGKELDWAEFTPEKLDDRYGHLLKNENLDREKVTNRLFQTFNQELGLLVEYRMLEEVLFAEISQLPVVVDGSEIEAFAIQVGQLKEKVRRQHIVLEYEGRRVSPYVVLASVDKQIAKQQAILTEKDKELYEEVIMNSIGRLISKRIMNAEKWVKQINQLMSERDTSSGLKFSLLWKPLTANQDDEMDTKDLVELLRSDQRLLKEDDLHRVSSHFRSCIERAKTLKNEKKETITFQQVIREILDYRQWFAFTLFYRYGDGAKKEMTNNAFFRFSGGEKAMAMYIPLFSAASSRYREARPDAPYIIALDEAFAGVDENNIRDMFDLVEKLGFNYIMNSQALWGDYDTVNSLAIYELICPKNAGYVTTIRYHWDGSKRHLLAGEDETFDQ